jgi:5-formyltetrahydrofolate cyclo-ligase
MDKPEQKRALRQQLIEQRLAMPDRSERCDLLQRVLRIWLVNRPDTVIGAYWPIKGEFDPLPALHRWKEDGELVDEPQLRRIGLPVVDKMHKTLTFHAWYPGCPMEEDAYGIPKPKDTEVIVPTLLFVPCVGYGPGGFRLGYGGGFYDRTLASLEPRPYTVGVGFTHGFLDELEPEPHDLPLDAILNDNRCRRPVSRGSRPCPDPALRRSSGGLPWPAPSASRKSP